MVLPIENRYRYSFKVRREEAPDDIYYSDAYGQVADQVEYFVSPTGAEYSYEGWSYDQNRFRGLTPPERSEEKTYVYAYYKDNVKRSGRYQKRSWRRRSRRPYGSKAMTTS